MITTNDNVIGLITENEMAQIRDGAVVVTSKFQVEFLKNAIELLEKMGHTEIEVQLADKQPIFFKPEQYKALQNTDRNIFTSVIGGLLFVI